MQQHEPSRPNCCIEELSAVVEGLHWGFRECLLDYVIFVAFQNNCKCLNSFWMHVVALCRYNVNLNVNVNLELRQSHAQLHMHHRLTRYIIATIYKTSHRVKKLMGHGSTPSDP